MQRNPIPILTVDKFFGSVDRTFWFGRFVLHSAISNSVGSAKILVKLTAIADSSKVDALVLGG